MTAPFILEGEGEDGKPKWLTFQCQGSRDPEDRCRIAINGQRNGSNATWTVEGADKAGPIDAPTVSPSVHCVGMCHFFIRQGRFEHCGDYPRSGGT